MTLTTEEASALVGRSPDVIHKWVERGKLKPIRRGSKPLLFREGDVIEAEFSMRPSAQRNRIDMLCERFVAQ